MLGDVLLNGSTGALFRVCRWTRRTVRRWRCALGNTLVVLALVIPAPAGITAGAPLSPAPQGADPALQAETGTPSATPTEVATPTDTEEPPPVSETPTFTLEPLPTPTETLTPSSEPTLTATVTETGTPTPTLEGTPTPTATQSPARGIFLVLDTLPSADDPATLLLQWRVEGWDALRELGREAIELTLQSSQDLSSIAEELGVQAEDPYSLRLPLADAQGEAMWRMPAEGNDPIYLRGELSLGGVLFSTASRIVNLTRSPSAAGDGTAVQLLPMGWEGETSGEFNFTWSGMGGEFIWETSPAGFRPQLNRASLTFAYGNLNDGSVIEVCSRGGLPSADDTASSVPQPARIQPAVDPGITFIYEDWLCVRQALDLQDQTSALRVGYFEGTEGWMAASAAEAAADPGDTYSWQVWVKSIDGVGVGPPVSPGGAGQSLLVDDETGTVYAATRGNVARSRDFYTGSPHWEDIHGVLPIPIGSWGGLIEFALDPFNPENRAWAVLGLGSGYGSVWRTDNLDDSPPTWVEILSQEEILQGTGGTFAGGRRIIASNVQPGLVFVAVTGDNGPGNNGLSVGRSDDYGETWTWAEALGGTGDRAIGMELSDQTADRLWVAVGLPNSRILVSNDGGETFGQLYGFGTWWNASDIHSPREGNPDDQVMFAEVLTDKENVYRSTNGGTAWSIVTYDAAYPGGLNRIVGSDYFDGQTVFYGSTDINGPFSFIISSDGGTGWEKRYTTSYGLTSPWMSPVNPDHLMTAYAGGASGPVMDHLVMFSSDGGFSWTDKTGDWATSIGTYYGSPGTSGTAATVTVVDNLN